MTLVFGIWYARIHVFGIWYARICVFGIWHARIYVFGIWHNTSCSMQGIASAWRSGPPGGGISSRRQALRGITSAWHGGPSNDGIRIMAVNTVGMYMMVAVEQSRMEEIMCYIECRFRSYIIDAPLSLIMIILIVSVNVMIEITYLAFMKD